ncbi:RBBP9/YdeN family alpha/beta hydrolase [Delftia acidovorans]|uniref:RBBP9/YdeN family alpha/beta hydrolase n=1 Tax=Delftia acidovorans TaxID=80866 RepID=UPI0022ABC1CB|nr:alpha/beta hydrolase [Delftia acidovorans]WAT87715.1 alpha/beta hydrolase [Delftia acidovorans]
MNPHRIIIVPGWRNSGPDHWQSLWAQQLPHAERVEQDDWLVPHRDPWVAALEQLVLSRPEPVVLAAHSLGCITAAHLGPEASARVRGALLVAPADPERRAQLADFAPVPYAPLPYRSVLVASSNDPYCPIRRAGAYARAWGSEFVRLQNAGHINVESGFGDWPLGLALLQSLMQGDSWQPSQPRPAVRSPRSPRPPRVAAAHASVSAGTGAGAPWAAGL